MIVKSANRWIFFFGRALYDFEPFRKLGHTRNALFANFLAPQDRLSGDIIVFVKIATDEARMTGSGTTNDTTFILKTERPAGSKRVAGDSFRLIVQVIPNRIYLRRARPHTLLSTLFFPQTVTVYREFSSADVIASLIARTTR